MLDLQPKFADLQNHISGACWASALGSISTYPKLTSPSSLRSSFLSQSATLSYFQAHKVGASDSPESSAPLLGPPHWDQALPILNPKDLPSWVPPLRLTAHSWQDARAPYCCRHGEHKLRGLKNHKVILFSFWRPGGQNQVWQANVKVWAGLGPSGRSRGESIPLPFLVYRGHLYSWAHDSFPLSLQPFGSIITFPNSVVKSSSVSVVRTLVVTFIPLPTTHHSSSQDPN